LVPTLVEEPPRAPGFRSDEEEEEGPWDTKASISLPWGVGKELVGEPVAVFPRWSTGGLLLTTLGAAVLVFFGLLLVLPFFEGRNPQAVTGATFGLVMAPIGLGLLIYVLATVGYRVIICERAIIDCTPFGVRVVLWDEVTGVYHVLTPYYVRIPYTARRRRVFSRSYRVDSHNGPSLHYGSSYYNSFALGSCLQREFARARFPQAMADLRAGKWLDFDAILISRWGVRAGEDQISWADIELFEVSGDKFYIMSRGGDPWASFPFTAVSNVELLKQLIRCAPQLGPGGG
jgi:hypothetical protein